MKKLALSFLLLFVLFGCQTEDPETVHLNILMPNGSPALAQVLFEAETPEIEGVTYEIERVFGPEPLLAAFGSQSHNVIFAPTNVGARLIASGAPYTLGAAINFGNNYIVANRSFNTIDDLAGEHIIAFGQQATPDIVLRSLLAASTIEEADLPTIEYRGSVQEALAALVADNDAIVLLAEPVLSVAQRQVENLQVLDLQAEWLRLKGEEGYPQAGIFIHDDVPRTLAAAYLAQIEHAINVTLQNPQAAAEAGVSLEYPFPLPVLMQAIPRSNLRFVSAIEARVSLETYFNVILEMNPNLIGGALPDDTFYFTE